MKHFPACALAALAATSLTFTACDKDDEPLSITEAQLIGEWDLVRWETEVEMIASGVDLGNVDDLIDSSSAMLVFREDGTFDVVGPARYTTNFGVLDAIDPDLEGEIASSYGEIERSGTFEVFGNEVRLDIAEGDVQWEEVNLDLLAFEEGARLDLGDDIDDTVSLLGLRSGARGRVEIELTR